MKRISPRNLAPHLPFVEGAVIYLLLDKLQAPGFVWGAVGVLLILWCLGVAVISFQMEVVDLFASDKETKSK
jgi:hypothetical protein